MNSKLMIGKILFIIIIRNSQINNKFLVNRHIHQPFHPSNINATYMVDQCL